MNLDLTTILTSVVTGFFAVLAVVIPIIINSRMKDATDAATMANAIKNSLGAIEQATKGQLTVLHPTVTIPGVPASLLPGVQYALDHAGTEFERAGITPLAVADKVSAAMGLQSLAAKAPIVVVPASPTAGGFARFPVVPPVPVVG
jgi:hypothetical protein